MQIATSKLRHVYTKRELFWKKNREVLLNKLISFKTYLLDYSLKHMNREFYIYSLVAKSFIELDYQSI